MGIICLLQILRLVEHVGVIWGGEDSSISGVRARIGMLVFYLMLNEFHYGHAAV